ncbi:MAG TPA: hypothetical protein VJR89_29880, partial [Polyangiales bacterium]|nr:hypothetical protein [Polyangiales bacterium]
MTKARFSRSILLALCLAGCAEGSERDAGQPAHGKDEPLYLVGTRVWDDASTTSYFHVLPSIEKGTDIEAARALEVAGAAKLFALADIGWFAIGAGERPSITRYALNARGALEEGARIDLSAYGVDDLWDTLYVVSKTKAYYPDRKGRQLIVWDPTRMQVTGSIDLPESARDGYLSLYGYAGIVRGSELLISVGWFDWEESDSVLGETGLIRIDTEQDEVVGFETDRRCGGVTQPIDTASGDTYLVSSALAGAASRLDRLPTKPCALRVRAGDNTIDADYFQELEALTQARVSGEPIPGGGDAMFLRVFDEKLAQIEEGAATTDLTGQSAWRWARWDVASGDVSKLDLEPSTSDVVWFQTDGHVYGSETPDDYS